MTVSCNHTHEWNDHGTAVHTRINQVNASMASVVLPLEWTGNLAKNADVWG